MLIKQKGNGMYAKKKYSEIDSLQTGPTVRSDWAIGWILTNGYACMNSYAINEIIKVIRSLRELGIEYTMKTIDGLESVSGENKWKDMYYEFTTVHLDDDREVK